MRAVKMRELQRDTMHTGSQGGAEDAPVQPAEFTTFLSAPALAPRRPPRASRRKALPS